MTQYTIEIIDRQSHPIPESRFLEEAICRVLQEEQVNRATISLALVDDVEIQRINRQFLNHDFPTDVISFLLDEVPHHDESAIISTEDAKTAEDGDPSFVNLNGELIASVETAIREASAHGWSPEAELLLYIVHGLLHLCGYDDLTDEARPVMRSRERELLALWGLCPTGLEM